MAYSGTKVYRHKYTYHSGKSGTNETTGLTKSEELYLKNSQSPAEQYEYTYDANGNVTEVKNLLDTSKNVTYEYDGLNRLVKERNGERGSEWRYTYDNGGNITCKRQFNSTGILTGTTNYGYSDSYWKDQLTSWGSYGTSSFAYDSAGNPTKYKGKNLTWQGKRLIKFANSTLSYMDLSYDGNGMLVGYTQNDTYSDWAGAQFTNVYSREMTRDGDRILSEKVTSIDGSLLTNDVKTVNYAYDERGASGMKVNGKYYYFVRNLFGDVTAIYDTSGVKKAEYSYDAWGTCYTTLDTDGLGSLNPFRYRGYYYISRIGLYYLTTRFYDYTTGRFLNADVPSVCLYNGFEIPEGSNLYSYCFNNPVMCIDPSGHFPWLFLVAVLLFTPVGGFVTQAAVSAISYVAMSAWALGDLIFNDGKGAWADMCSIKWNPFNTNENKVVESNNISFYKGVPVFQISGMGGSMSLGAIFFDKSQEVEVLKHERGHNTQLMSMGLGNYLIQIGIPSVWKNGDETPWELSASMLGGSALANGYSDKQKQRARNYFIRAMLPIINIYNVFQYLFY